MFALMFSRQIFFNGIIQGLVYGLLGMALLLVYRSSKVINFAAGAMGLIGVDLFILLVINWGMPYWFSLALALVVGALYGGVLELIVVRRLFKAPRIILLVATIGVSQLSMVIMMSLPNVENLSAQFPQAISHVWKLGGVRVLGPQAFVIITVPLVWIFLTWFLNRTLVGRCVRASSDNPDLTRLSGVNPKMLSTLVWSIAGVLGTIAMTLIVGLNGSTTGLTNLGPTSLLRALAALTITRFRSFRGVMAAGMVIALSEGMLHFNITTVPGLVEVLLLVTLLVAVAVQQRERASGDAAFSHAPKVPALPDRLRHIFWLRHLDRITLLVLLAAAVALPIIVTSPSRHMLYTSMLAYGIVALSITVLTGWAGQLSLGQMAFGGIGALAAAALTNGMLLHWKLFGVQLLNFELYPMPFALSIALAGLITAAVAAVVGAGALRVRGLLLAAVTFSFAIAASSYIYKLDVLTGGKSKTVEFFRGNVGPWDLREPRAYYYAALGALVLCAALVSRLRRSGVGRVTIAVRDNPATASAYTVRPAVTKLRAFALSGFLAGVGGALLAGIGQKVTLGDDRFEVAQSLLLVSMAVIGGMGSMAGAVIGSLWVIGIPALAPKNDLLTLLSSSIGLLVLLLYFPGGFVNIAHRVRSAIYRRMEAKLPPLEKSAASSIPPASIGRSHRAEVDLPVLLKATDVSVTFGGVRANDRVSLEVRRDEIVGLIGTNGAGKTTLMNAIGGYVHSTGLVELLGRDVSHDQAAERARKGLGRTFQAASLFPELTVRETVMVALEARGRSSMLGTIVFSPRQRSLERSKRAEAGELIDFLGLGRYADRPISELSTGTRRIVELAGLLALDAKVLCLDEPTAGVAQRETEAMGPLLVEIRKQLGASMLIIEHDMPLIMGISDRVYCLETGRVIASGEPAEVRNDPKVIASYLGTDQRTIDRSGPVA